MEASASLPALPTHKQAARLSQSKVRGSIRSEVRRLLDWTDGRHPAHDTQPRGAAQRTADVERWITHKAQLPQLGPYPDLGFES